MLPSPKIYLWQFEVRGYELDAYHHVNHATYFNYCEEARWKMLSDEGIYLRDFETWKRWPVVAAIEARYLKPTYAGDQLQIRSQIVEHGKTHFHVSQTIYKQNTPVFEAKIHAVVIDENGRPNRMPPEFYRLWGESEPAE